MVNAPKVQDNDFEIVFDQPLGVVLFLPLTHKGPPYKVKNEEVLDIAV